MKDILHQLLIEKTITIFQLHFYFIIELNENSIKSKFSNIENFIISQISNRHLILNN